MNRRTVATASVAGFLGTILAANFVTTHHGLVPVGFGYVATAGTYFAGLAFVLRDTLHEAIGVRKTLAVIAVGAILSFVIADPFIALASAAAFAVSEVVDLGIYAPLRRRGYVRAAIASNVAGALVDTFLFLWIAGFPIAGAWQGQMVGKFTVTAVAVGAVVLARSSRRVTA